MPYVTSLPQGRADLAILSPYCMAVIGQHQTQYEHAETETEGRGELAQLINKKVNTIKNVLLKHVDISV